MRPERYSLIVLLLTASVLIQPVHAQTSTTYADAAEMQTKSAGSVYEVVKCGVNTFQVVTYCESEWFRYLYFKCYDGYNEWRGDESTCRPSEDWQRIAEAACTGHCSNTTVEFGESEPPPGVSPVEAKPVSVCYISDSLMKQYDSLIYEMKEATTEGDAETAEAIREKVTSLKDEIAKAQEQCGSAGSAGGAVIQARIATEAGEASMAVAVDKCNEAQDWQSKIAYYEKLQSLSESQLREEFHLTGEEIGKILRELREGYRQVMSQCETQRREYASTAVAMPVPTLAIAEPVKPVAPDSGTEIETYYRARIEKISSLDSIDTQIDQLKKLRDEIDQLMADMIRYKNEIEASEFSGLADVEIRPDEIRANDIVINTSGTEKRIRMMIGTKNVTVEPREAGVFIVEEGIQAQAVMVSVEDNKLMVGDSEVSVPASEVVQRFGILKTPKMMVELGEEDGKAVYNIQVEEDRNLLGIIPVKMERSLTADATDPEAGIIRDDMPWWSFLTTVAASSYEMGTFQQKTD